jgi:hypothetical protein
MHAPTDSSGFIGQLASALAKAQIDLVNPAKTLTAVIYDRRSPEERRSYRYAPLSAGLEIVRKTLGQHELAVIQATDVDRESGLVMLTTKLAHGSGEWISSTWPVCRITDFMNPKLMGAALTYARRYSLFALVGITGEDDLDAADLPEADRTDQTPGVSHELARGARPPVDGVADSPVVAEPFRETNSHVGAGHSPSPPVSQSCARDRKRRREHSIPNGSPLSPDASDAHLVALDTIEDAEALVRWALASLSLRNRVSDETRARLDAAFIERARSIGADPELLLPFASSPPADGFREGHETPRLP